MCQRWSLIFFFVEEVLIGFRELIGQHSGANMANAVWEVMGEYDLHDKVAHNSL